MKDCVVSRAHGTLTYSVWETYVKQMRGESSLQQPRAEQASAVPGIGSIRTDYSLAAGFMTPAALASAYGRITSQEKGKNEMSSVSPPRGRSRLPKPVSAYMYSFFTADMYGYREGEVRTVVLGGE